MLSRFNKRRTTGKSSAVISSAVGSTPTRSTPTQTSAPNAANATYSLLSTSDPSRDHSTIVPVISRRQQQQKTASATNATTLVTPSDTSRPPPAAVGLTRRRGTPVSLATAGVSPPTSAVISRKAKRPRNSASSSSALSAAATVGALSPSINAPASISVTPSNYSTPRRSTVRVIQKPPKKLLKQPMRATGRVRKIVKPFAKELIAELKQKDCIMNPRSPWVEAFYDSQKELPTSAGVIFLYYNLEKDKLGMTSNISVRNGRYNGDRVLVLFKFDCSMDQEMDDIMKDICMRLLDAIISDEEIPYEQRQYMKAIRDDGAGNLGLFRQLAAQVAEIGGQYEFDFNGRIMEFLMCHAPTLNSRHFKVIEDVEIASSVLPLEGVTEVVAWMS